MFRRIAPALALLALLAAGPASAASASLVLDIDAGSSPLGGWSVGPLYPLGDRALFSNSETSSGGELWVTDGTQDGTEMVLDTCPGACGQVQEFLGTLGRTAIFFANDELWRSDGTKAGTRRIISSQNAGPSPCSAYKDETKSVTLGRLIFFTSGLSCNLWQTDGTPAGTRIVHPSWANNSPMDLVPAGGKLYFVSRTSLYVTDGTRGGSRVVRTFDLHDGGPGYLVAAGSQLFFVVYVPIPDTVDFRTELWTSDGTAAGTRLIPGFERFERPVVFDGVAYFAAQDGAGSAVWKSDGTAAGTRRITGLFASGAGNPIAKVGGRLIFPVGATLWSTAGTPQTTVQISCPGSCPQLSVPYPYLSSEPAVVTLGDRAIFPGADPVHGRELWLTDGTRMQLVRDICPGRCSTEPHLLTALLDTMFFLVEIDEPYHFELWQTDGTPRGTARLLDLGSQPFIYQPFRPAVVDGRILFGHRAEIWESDGPAGIRVAVRFGSTGHSSFPDGLTALADQVLFTACDGEDRSFWRSAGTAASTIPLRSTASSCSSFRGPYSQVPAGGLLYLLLESDAGSGLWRTDGTEAGTFLLRPGGALLTSFHGRLAFLTSDPETKRDSLWESDGTPEGTRMLFELPQGLSNPRELTAVGPELYFIATAVGYPYPIREQLFRSDGTLAGTRQLTFFGKHLFESTPFVDPPQLTRAGNLVFFLSTAGFVGPALWRTDGTPEGTFAIWSVTDENIPAGTTPLQLAAMDGALYFTATTSSGKGERGLFRTDGTLPGTQLIYAPLGTPEPGASARARPVRAIGHQLFLAADDGEHGVELWRSDGTTAGTRLVRDILPGEGSSQLGSFQAAGDLLFFAATDGEHGVELWQSDGTEDGTRMVQDIAPGPVSSHPEELTVAGDKLFFRAYEGAHGQEVWVYPLAGPPGCQPSEEVLCLAGGRFRVDATWRDFQGNSGTAHAVSLTPDTGYFWFFDPANVEVILKVLDGRESNGHHWVFYGALSSVEYTLTVTDTQTGAARRYLNPPGRLASVADTQAFGPKGATGSSLTFGPQGAAMAPGVSARAAATEGSCVPGPTRLCLQGGRFAVEIRWKDFQGKTGAGQAVPLSGGDTGWFWFFGPDNVEVVVKVLDGRPLNGKFWVFFGALSNVEYTVTVTDTVTGQVKTYENPSGRLASVADTKAF